MNMYQLVADVIVGLLLSYFFTVSVLSSSIHYLVVCSISWFFPVLIPSDNQTQNTLSFPMFLEITGNIFLEITVYYSVLQFITLVGGLNPCEKYESQLGLFFPIEWTNKIHVPNHQPVQIT